MSKQIQTAQNKLPGELPEHVEADCAHFQSLSFAEHARILEAVCAAAMDILAARQRMGIAPPEPEPFPSSFVQFHSPKKRNTPDPTT
jgi:hypothetical protein